MASTTQSLSAPPAIGDATLEQLNARASRTIHSTLSPGQTRTVTLLAGVRTDPIICEVAAVPFTERSHDHEDEPVDEDEFDDEAPSYEALSYAWGSQEKPAALRLNARKYWITEPQ